MRVKEGCHRLVFEVTQYTVLCPNVVIPLFGDLLHCTAAVQNRIALHNRPGL